MRNPDDAYSLHTEIKANVPVRFGNFNYKDKTFRFSDVRVPHLQDTGGVPPTP